MFDMVVLLCGKISKRKTIEPLRFAGLLAGDHRWLLVGTVPSSSPFCSAGIIETDVVTLLHPHNIFLIDSAYT
jgi:hypothetical protein